MKKQNQREKIQASMSFSGKNYIDEYIPFIYLNYVLLWFFNWIKKTTSIACISLIIITTNITVIKKETSHFWVG